MNSAITVIVVEYKSVDDLPRLVESLKKYEPDIDVLVSSNSCYSDDESRAFEKQFPSVRLLRNARNGGYAYGVNCAMREVKTPYVVILNPDVEVTAPFVDQAVETFAKYPRLGAFSPLVTDGEGNDTTVAKRFWLPYFALARLLSRRIKGGRLEKAHEFYLRADKAHDHFQAIDSCSGGVMFVRCEAFDSVRGFDEGYFMYMEDADFCRQLWMSGWFVALQPSIEMIHRAHFDSTDGLLSIRKLFSRTRRAHLMSYCRYFYKWGNEHYFPSDNWEETK